jgi:hypothetical protein
LYGFPIGHDIMARLRLGTFCLVLLIGIALPCNAVTRAQFTVRLSLDDTCSIASSVVSCALASPYRVDTVPSAILVPPLPAAAAQIDTQRVASALDITIVTF